MSFAIRASLLSFATLLIATISQAQSHTQATPMQSSTDMQQTELHQLTDVQRQPGVKVDPKEESAYDAFYRLGSENPDKKIQLGNAFLQKYPNSIFTEAVDVGLTNAYYDKQDWKDFYTTADNALALKSDDVDVLATVGWVIPHFYNPHDANADQQLDKAEASAKHAIEVMAQMSKPSGLTDAEFASSKTQKSIQAHSALGLIYFRREDYENSAKQLQLSIQNNPNPDQTDLYVLGLDLQNLNRNAEATDAFGRCSQMVGGLADRCKQISADAQQEVGQKK